MLKKAAITTLVTAFGLLASCGGGCPNTPTAAGPGNGEKMKTTDSGAITQERIDATVQAILPAKGEARDEEEVRVGVEQVARLWRASDGTPEEFQRFCEQSFVTDTADLDQLFYGFQDNMEQIFGHLHEVSRFLREPTDLDRGPVRPVDEMFAAYDLFAHVVDDLFESKIAFVILLNFEVHDLDTMLEEGEHWSRDLWAKARAAQLFRARVPSSVEREITEAFVKSDSYISSYNIHMHHLLTEDGRRIFPEGMKLISHWGLRDELKSHYGQEDGLEKQRMIHEVMKRIISQEIPAAVVDNPFADWTVTKGEVKPAEVIDVEEAEWSHRKDIPITDEREPDRRYEELLRVFNAVRKEDPFHPTMPSYVERKFNMTREIPKERVEELLVSVASAPVIKDMGALIEKRMGRKLEPFDIWYDGFKARGSISQAELDKAVLAKYPTVEAFQKDIPNILEKLGFSKETAAFLESKIVVDPARGAGHAMGAMRREDSAHLRTRVPADGMNYKGYNIAIHELGHNVEQVLSLNKMDHYLLNGVPNTAFTEGFAFVFQGKDLELLGIENKDPDAAHLNALDALWGTYEIGGVALVDMAIWDWMYAHPEATPAELREAMLGISKDVWNKYFAPVFGVKDQTILAIYSHIIDGGMYIPDYPIGGLIQFQVEDYFEGKNLAVEMERMCKLGAITPASWMQQAVGAPISAKPMITAAEEAVKKLSK